MVRMLITSKRFCTVSQLHSIPKQSIYVLAIFLCKRMKEEHFMQDLLL